MSYTSIEQSKKLLELGLKPETADAYYKYVLPKNTDKIHHVPEVGEPTNALEWYNKGYTLSGKEPLTLEEFCIPCWSLEALLEALPTSIQKCCEDGRTRKRGKSGIKYAAAARRHHGASRRDQPSGA